VNRKYGFQFTTTRPFVKNDLFPGQDKQTATHRLKLKLELVENTSQTIVNLADSLVATGAR
jgi:hypothetical protein